VNSKIVCNFATPTFPAPMTRNLALFVCRNNGKNDIFFKKIQKIKEGKEKRMLATAGATTTRAGRGSGQCKIGKKI
jgi:hypothetical protein